MPSQKQQANDGKVVHVLGFKRGEARITFTVEKSDADADYTIYEPRIRAKANRTKIRRPHWRDE